LRVAGAAVCAARGCGEGVCGGEEVEAEGDEGEAAQEPAGALTASGLLRKEAAEGGECDAEVGERGGCAPLRNSGCAWPLASALRLRWGAWGGVGWGGAVRRASAEGPGRQLGRHVVWAGSTYMVVRGRLAEDLLPLPHRCDVVLNHLHGLLLAQPVEEELVDLNSRPSVLLLSKKPRRHRAMLPTPAAGEKPAPTRSDSGQMAGGFRLLDSCTRAPTQTG
jgi:hypothetical protein